MKAVRDAALGIGVEVQAARLTTGVRDALASVPRYDKVPEARQMASYLDQPLAVGRGRYCHAPSTVGALADAAGLKPGETTLVVGGGTGYTAAILDQLGGDVTVVEPNASLSRVAVAAGLRAVARFPWDQPLEDGVVVLDGAVAPELSERLLKWCGPGVRLVAPTYYEEGVQLTRWAQHEGSWRATHYGDVAIAGLPNGVIS